MKSCRVPIARAQPLEGLEEEGHLGWYTPEDCVVLHETFERQDSGMRPPRHVSAGCLASRGLGAVALTWARVQAGTDKHLVGQHHIELGEASLYLISL